MARIAIIGAGLAGLVLARGLGARHDVTVYEKSRGVGGRLATRYALDRFEFDHGAQFFTARSAGFKEFLEPLVAAGHVAPWRARFAEFSGAEISSERQWDASYPHYVAVPRMNALGKVLRADGDIRAGHRVSGVQRSASGWQLTVESSAGGVESADADWLIATVPLAQARALTGDLSIGPAVEAAVGERRMLGCFALMLGFDRPPELPFDAALVREADISWMSVNSSKPGRDPLAPTMVVHATNRWAEANMERNVDDVLEHMAAEVTRLTGLALDAAVHKAVHRWRFANSPKATGSTHFIDTDNQFALAGDWWIRGRVESAFLSAEGLLDVLETALA